MGKQGDRYSKIRITLYANSSNRSRTWWLAKRYHHQVRKNKTINIGCTSTSQRQFALKSLSVQLKFRSPSVFTYGKLALPCGLTHEEFVSGAVYSTAPRTARGQALKAVSYSESWRTCRRIP